MKTQKQLNKRNEQVKLGKLSKISRIDMDQIFIRVMTQSLIRF